MMLLVEAGENDVTAESEHSGSLEKQLLHHFTVVIIYYVRYLGKAVATAEYLQVALKCTPFICGHAIIAFHHGARGRDLGQSHLRSIHFFMHDNGNALHLGPDSRARAP